MMSDFFKEDYLRNLYSFFLDIKTGKIIFSSNSEKNNIIVRFIIFMCLTHWIHWYFFFLTTFEPWDIKFLKFKRIEDETYKQYRSKMIKKLKNDLQAKRNSFTFTYKNYTFKAGKLPQSIHLMYCNDLNSNEYLFEDINKKNFFIWEKLKNEQNMNLLPLYWDDFIFLYDYNFYDIYPIYNRKKRITKNWILPLDNLNYVELLYSRNNILIKNIIQLQSKLGLKLQKQPFLVFYNDRDIKDLKILIRKYGKLFEHAVKKWTWPISKKWKGKITKNFKFRFYFCKILCNKKYPKIKTDITLQYYFISFSSKKYLQYIPYNNIFFFKKLTLNKLIFCYFISFFTFFIWGAMNSYVIGILTLYQILKEKKFNFVYWYRKHKYFLKEFLKEKLILKKNV